MGAERNPNVVKLTSYAPSFQNFNWYNWTPNLVAFTANYDETVASVSYYSQKLLASFRGTHTLPVTATEGEINPLWWVATIEDAKNVAYVKVINSGATTIPLSVSFDVGFSAVNGTMLVNSSIPYFDIC
jgi:alpha-N-arabinofuranosidase